MLAVWSLARVFLNWNSEFSAFSYQASESAALLDAIRYRTSLSSCDRSLIASLIEAYSLACLFLELKLITMAVQVQRHLASRRGWLIKVRLVQLPHMIPSDSIPAE